MAPFKISNQWLEVNPRARMVSVTSLALHPRDIGTLLIGYNEGAAIYSFKQNKVMKFFAYEVPAGAPGGDVDPSTSQKVRWPKLVQAVWHPTGTFILTCHDDETLVMWDAKTGTVTQARTLQDPNVNIRGTRIGSFGSSSGTLAIKAPIAKVAWCAKQNPDDTGILVAGGAPTHIPERGLTFFDLGPTPVYATSSWQVLQDLWAKPKSTKLLPTPIGTDVLDFCIIPRTSPHFAGAHDPIAIIAVLSSGELTTLSFPSGHPIPPTNQLHVSLSFVHPFANKIDLASVDRTRWLGLKEQRPSGPLILKGGAEGPRRMKRFEGRNIVQTAHADGTVKIWDSGDADQIENPDVIQVDVARAVGRTGDVDILHSSMAGASGELAAGLRSGEVLIFRWEQNRNFGRELPFRADEELGLCSVSDNADPALKEGLLPLTMFPGSGAPCTAVKLSDIGFCAAGFENGTLAVIDLRGPALIFDASLNDVAKMERRRSILKSNSQAMPGKLEWATKIEFSIMSLEGERFCSILLFVGTNHGRLLTYRIVPESGGAYGVQPAGTANVEDEVIMIYPLNAQTGQSAFASQQAYAGLRSGVPLDGSVIVVTRRGAKIFKPAEAKGASKSWNDCLCDTAAVARSENSAALVGLFGDGSAKTFSIPALKELASVRVDNVLDIRQFSQAVIAPNADIVGWTGPSELAIVSPWGSGVDNSQGKNELFNPSAIIPPRPTISNLQWISGTQYVTPIDMDTLVGGPDRPPSKRMLEQMRADEALKRDETRAGASGNVSSAQKEGESYWQYMQRQVQERTERLNLTGDSMDKLEDSSSGWADDVSKFVSSQKKKAAMGSMCKSPLEPVWELTTLVLGSKFGF